MNISKTLKNIRKIRGISQKALGYDIGVSESRIGQFEMGSYANPKLQTLQKLSDALEVSLLVFFELNLETLGDIKSLLYQLDEQVGIKFVGEKQEDGTLKEGTISISFDNEYIDAFLKEWSDKRHELAQADEAVQQKALAGEVFDLGLDYEYETYTQEDSKIMVSKGHVGEYKEFPHKPDKKDDT